MKECSDLLERSVEKIELHHHDSRCVPRLPQKLQPRPYIAYRVTVDSVFLQCLLSRDPIAAIVKS